MKKIHGLSAILVPVLFAAACGGGGDSKPAAPASSGSTPAPAASAGPVKGNSGVKGSIRFEGTPPKAAKVSMNADPKCQAAHSGDVFASEVRVDGNGNLRDVFVYVKAGLEGKKYPVPSEPVVFDQKGCTYEPRVLGIQAKQTLKILNSDDTLHNVHALPQNSDQFNIAMPKFLKEKEQSFANPEVMVRVKCEVHPWMGAWIGVLDHPFFSVSGASGAFSIQGLPDGDYTIEAWHEKFGQQTQQVSLAAGEVKDISFTFTAN